MDFTLKNIKDPFEAQMPREFRQMIENLVIGTWPSRNQLGAFESSLKIEKKTYRD